MTPQEVYEAKKLARLNELSLKYTGRPYSAPTKTRPPKLTKEQRKERKERASPSPLIVHTDTPPRPLPLFHQG